MAREPHDYDDIPGTFVFDASAHGEQVSVSLQGFETTTVGTWRR